MECHCQATDILLAVIMDDCLSWHDGLPSIIASLKKQQGLSPRPLPTLTIITL